MNPNIIFYVKVPILEISYTNGAPRYKWCEEYAGTRGIDWERGSIWNGRVQYGFADEQVALLFALKWS